MIYHNKCSEKDRKEYINMIKISIIVPIYNNDQYLQQCLESVLHQNYDNIEVLAINNGSTDKSLTIINDLAQTDSRLRPVTIPHTSLGAVKNLGIAMATGDFISFIHPTDFISDDWLNQLVNSQQKYNSDIACSTYYRIDSNGTYYFYVNNDDPAQQRLAGVFTPREWVKREVGVSANMTDLFRQDFNKIIKRSLFTNVMFPNTDYGVDNFTIWKLFLLADRISYINNGEYCYRMLVTPLVNSQEKFDSQLAQLKSLEERMAIYNLIDFDSSFLNQTYIDLLATVRDSALTAGNYHYYKDCCFKLEMIKKYSTTEEQ